jgi:hypothetical protein
LRFSFNTQWLKDYLVNHSISQGGYDRNLPGKFQGSNLHILGGRETLGGRKRAITKRVINVQEPFPAERFVVGMGPIGPNCKEMTKLAEKNFCHGWDTKEVDCNIFSIGGNNEWSFETKVIEEAPHCVVHTYNCTLAASYEEWKISGNPIAKKPNDDRIKFYLYCIGSVSRDHFRTYSDLLNISNTEVAPRILKMDIEGFEYSVVLNILTQTYQDMWPEQIAMEIHWASRMVHLSWMFHALQASEVSLFFSTLFSVGGYLPVFREFFPRIQRRAMGCVSCMEVLMVRALCNKS